MSRNNRSILKLLALLAFFYFAGFACGGVVFGAEPQQAEYVVRAESDTMRHAFWYSKTKKVQMSWSKIRTHNINAGDLVDMQVWEAGRWMVYRPQDNTATWEDAEGVPIRFQQPILPQIAETYGAQIGPPEPMPDTTLPDGVWKVGDGMAYPEKPHNLPLGTADDITGPAYKRAILGIGGYEHQMTLDRMREPDFGEPHEPEVAIVTIGAPAQEQKPVQVEVVVTPAEPSGWGWILKGVGAVLAAAAVGYVGWLWKRRRQQAAD